MNNFFTGTKYITRGIQSDLSRELQIYLWQHIEKLKHMGIELDYLQVFNLTIEYQDDKPIQVIEHLQEQPPYSQITKIKTAHPIQQKIFVISSYDENGQEYSTMMLADEY